MFKTEITGNNEMLITLHVDDAIYSCFVDRYRWESDVNYRDEIETKMLKSIA